MIEAWFRNAVWLVMALISLLLTGVGLCILYAKFQLYLAERDALQQTEEKTKTHEP